MDASALDEGARRAVWPDSFKEPGFPYSPGIAACGWVFASAQMATDLVTGLAPEAKRNPRNPLLENPVELQSWVLMKFKVLCNKTPFAVAGLTPMRRSPLPLVVSLKY